MRTFKALQTSYGDARRFKRRSCKRFETKQRKNEKLTKGHIIFTFTSITAYDDDGEEDVDVCKGNVANKCLRKFAFFSGTDKTFALRDNDGKFYIRNKESNIKENNILLVIKNKLARLDYWSLLWQRLQMMQFSPMGIIIIMLK